MTDSSNGPLQLAAVILLVIGSLAYASWRIYQRLRATDDPCAGCNGCELKNRSQTSKHRKCNAPDAI